VTEGAEQRVRGADWHLTGGVVARVVPAGTDVLRVVGPERTPGAVVCGGAGV